MDAHLGLLQPCLALDLHHLLGHDFVTNSRPESDNAVEELFVLVHLSPVLIEIDDLSLQEHIIGEFEHKAFLSQFGDLFLAHEDILHTGHTVFAQHFPHREEGEELLDVDGAELDLFEELHDLEENLYLVGFQLEMTRFGVTCVHVLDFG